MPRANTGEIRVFVRVRDKQGGAEGWEGIQLFSIIQNATSKVELVRLPTTVWRLKSGLEPRGMLACTTFINLITEILICGGGGARASFLAGKVFFNSEARDTNPQRSPCLHSLGLTDRGTHPPPPVWRHLVIERLKPPDRLQIFINFSGQLISHSGE